MNRRDFIKSSAVAALPMVSSIAVTSFAKEVKPFEWQESTVTQLRRALKSGKETAESLTRKYLRRIEEIDKAGPGINAVMELNPDALAIARDLDKQRKKGAVPGPLHGIPVLIKDNIDTHDRMMTTAGSLALMGSRPGRDAFVVRRLRDAGAVILGKTNLSEWANFRSTTSTSGWSGRGGLTKNPYVLDRNPSGSSSGTAVALAASLCALGVGTETNGSIVCPASCNGVVGLKPTVGLVSRAGIIPIAHSQDTAGPMARTVGDVALLLEVLAGADANDPATRVIENKAAVDYTKSLVPDGLRGARIGVARQFFDLGEPARQVCERALRVMKDCGAVLVDPVELASWKEMQELHSPVLYYEFKADLNAYLAGLGPSAPVKSLEEIIAFNERNREREMPFFRQELFLKAQEKGPLTDSAYLNALSRGRRLMREEGIDAVMDKHRLDAIVAPTTGPAYVTDLVYGDADVGACTAPAAVAGYPHLAVPAGEVMGLPVGLSFFGRAFSEATLLKLAFAFEQASNARKAPRFLPTVTG